MALNTQSEKFSNSTIVDFICLGGNKCATTWLSEVFRLHPEVNISINKEPAFFDINYDRGYDWYNSNWDSQDGFRGEFSTSYLYSEEAIKRIKKDLPDVKLITILRNPYDRSISHYEHVKRDWVGEKSVSLFDKDPTIIGNSLYYMHIKRLLNYFEKDQIHIVFFDEIPNKPEKVYDDVCAFLNISSDNPPDILTKEIGSDYTPRFSFLERLKNKCFHHFKDNNMGWIINISKKYGVSDFYRWFNSNSSVQEPPKILKKDIESILKDLDSLKTIIDSKYIKEWYASISK